MTVVRFVARPLLASMFVVGGVHALRHSAQLAPAAAPMTDKISASVGRAVPQVPVPQDAQQWVRLNGAVQLLAGLALATGRAPRLSSLLLAGSTAFTTAAGHRFWEETDPARKADQQVHFFKNVSMLGGLLISAVDTEGRPGVAWRARRAARDARREAGHLATTTRREAKLVAAKVG